MLTPSRLTAKRWRKEKRRRKLTALRRTLMAVYGLMKGSGLYSFLREKERERQAKRMAILSRRAAMDRMGL